MAYQLVKDMTTVKQEKLLLSKVVQKMPHRRMRDSEPMDRILL